MSDINTLLEGFTHGKSSNESTSEHISGTIGIDDLVIGEFGDGERSGVGSSLLNVGCCCGWVGRSDEGRVGTLGDDNETRSGRVGFGRVGKGESGLFKGCVLDR